jgi:L-alanine-DL-glutamate epimerase-like enolase superfamily enzyme
MKITRLRTQVVEFPYSPPIGLSASYVLRTGSCVLVFLESDDGAVGEGLVFAFNGERIKLYDDMVKSFAPLVVGQDPRQGGAIFARLWGDIRTVGQSGFAVNALAAVDMALWDLRAKLAGVNVAHLIGSCRTTIPVYDSGWYWLTLSLDELQKNAAAQMARGFRAFKLRISGKIPEDIKRARAMRDVIGPDAGLLVDLNQRSTVPDAIRLGHALEEFNLTWFEEPVHYLNHAGEAEITAAIDAPVASGESVYTSRGILAMLQGNACDIVMPDLQHMGGPTEFLRAATYSQAFETQCSNHCFTEMSIALLAAIPNVNWLEYMHWLEPVYKERLELTKDGHAVVPTTPGWGFSFDADAVKKYAAAS